MVPFGALIAMIGLEHVHAAATPRARAMAFVAAWASIIGLALVYRADLRDAQAIIRAATVPLAVAGLAAILKHVETQGFGFRQLATVGLPVLIALQIAYRILSYETVMSASVVLVSTVCLAPLWPPAFDRVGRRPSFAVAALALVAGLFVHVYVDYTNIRSIALIRPSISVAALRFLAACTAFAAVVWLVRRIGPDQAIRGRARIALVALVVTQLTYYYLDFFPDFAPRYVQAMVVLLGSVGLARLRGADDGARLTLGQITAAALIAVVATQFARVYVNDYTGTRPQRAAFETALTRAQGRVVPAVYPADRGTGSDVLAVLRAEASPAGSRGRNNRAPDPTEPVAGASFRHHSRRQAFEAVR